MDLILAKSKAGHDKNQIYVVLEEREDGFLLANGETKLLAKPKFKKMIHLQLIKNLPSDIIELNDSLKELDDVSIRKILKLYNRRNKDV